MNANVRNLAAWLVLAWITMLGPQAAARLSLDALQRVDAMLQAQVDEGKIAGAVLQINYRGRVVKSLALGMQDREANVPLRTDSIFRIASQTKAIISTAVMMLQERGALVITDPVGKYLPEYTNTTVAVPNDDGGYNIVSAQRAITIRDLLTHTAGIGYGTGPAAEQWLAAGIQGWYFAHQVEPVRETVRRIAALPFDAQPGERWVYGYNTDVLGALIEEVSGVPLDRFLFENVFEPLGMIDTHFYLPTAKADRLAAVYTIGDDGKLRRAPDESTMFGQGAYVQGPRQSFSGGAGLLSTAADYSRFLEAMRQRGKRGNNRILGRKSVELMVANHLGNITFRPGMGFGLGFSTIEDLGAQGAMGSLGTFAWGGAYHTTYWIDPSEELTVSYMTQLLNARGSDDQSKLRAMIYAALQ
jgi:CubicO group peptidase (beta-lactamase class C family)